MHNERNIMCDSPTCKIPDPADPRHGSVNGYSNLKCKCDPCRLEWNRFCREYQRAQRAKRKAFKQFVAGFGPVHMPEPPRTKKSETRAWVYRNDPGLTLADVGLTGREISNKGCSRPKGKSVSVNRMVIAFDVFELVGKALDAWDPEGIDELATLKRAKKLFDPNNFEE